MIRRPVIIQKDMDKEDHPIALLVQEASQYDSQVYIEIENKKINAKSLIGMMSLKLKKGLNIIVVSHGLSVELRGPVLGRRAGVKEAAASGVEKFLAAQS